jgi:hypothetical protein
VSIGSKLIPLTRILDPFVLVSGAQLEHDLSLISPSSTVVARPQTPSIGKVPKILLEVANQNAAETEFLTPQKRLLNSRTSISAILSSPLSQLCQLNSRVSYVV